MTVGFLHIGDPEHGVTRYGRVVARGVAKHTRLTVRHATTGQLQNGRGGIRQVRDAAAALSAADVVHVQYNERVWGGPLRAPFTVRAFADACRAPWVATLHDVRDGYDLRSIVRRLVAQRTSSAATSARDTEDARSTEDNVGGFLRCLSERLSIGEIASAARKALRYLAREAANAWATRRVMQHAAQVLVCTREEARRLQAFGGRRDAARVDVIPHFVEPRPPLPDRAAAKHRLGLQGRRVASVLGFIHRRKGHDFVVNALPHLPPDVTVLFIGRAGRKDDGFLDALRTQAEALGVTDRLRITGYVPDGVLDDYLAATDVAVCPFREASASGSLSTWIAAGPPLVTSDVPLFAEYNALVPGTLQTVEVSCASALATAIQTALCADPADEHRHDALRRRLSLASVATQHARCYRRLAPLGASALPE